jgi:hypothetical protein
MPLRRTRRSGPGYSDSITNLERARAGAWEWVECRKTVMDGVEEIYQIGEDVRELQRAFDNDHDRRIEKLEQSRAKHSAVEGLAVRIEKLEAKDKERGNLGRRIVHWIIQTTTALALLSAGMLLRHCHG